MRINGHSDECTVHHCTISVYIGVYSHPQIDGKDWKSSHHHWICRDVLFHLWLGMTTSNLAISCLLEWICITRSPWTSARPSSQEPWPHCSPSDASGRTGSVDVEMMNPLCQNYSGWWFFATPLKNMSSSVGMIRHPILMGNKIHVPNHQPDILTTGKRELGLVPVDPVDCSLLAKNGDCREPVSQSSCTAYSLQARHDNAKMKVAESIQVSKVMLVDWWLSLGKALSIDGVLPTSHWW